jgi:beta-glucanase (GH16 family)
MARRRYTVLTGLAGLLATAALMGSPAGVPLSLPAAVAADQTAAITVLPPISQPGTAPAAMANALTVLAVQVQPATVGRRVVLARLVKKSWRTVATATLGVRGLAEFRVPTPGSQAVRYRATADPTDGLPALVATASVSSATWGPVDFADEFSGTSLGSAWNTRGTAYNPAGLRGCSKGSPNAALVSGGLVRLSVVADPARQDLCTAYRKDGSVIGQFRYRLNGHIGTQLSADLRYGVAAARVKFQQSRGQHGAFWLQPTAPAAGSTSPADAGAEIDTIEWFGEGSGGLASNVYYPSPAGLVKAGGWVADASSYLSSSEDSWWTGYHVFSVEWTPTAYIFRIDGRETWRTSEGVSGTPEYLILSLLSSDYELPLLGGEDRLPQHMDVDWAAFWEA